MRRGLRAGQAHSRLVGERDGQLAENSGVERRCRVQSLHVRLGGAQLVPGEVRLRRGEAELGRAFGQHLVQRGQPGCQRLQVRGGEPDLTEASGVGAEREIGRASCRERVSLTV